MTLHKFLVPRVRSVGLIGTALKLLWSAADGAANHLIAITLLLVLSAAVLAGVTPLLLKIIIDDLASIRAGVTYPLVCLVSAYAFAHWCSRSLGELRNMYFGRADQRIQRRLSDKLCEHLMALPLRFHLNRRTGALNQTLTNGLLGYRMVLHHLLLTMLPVVVELASMCAVLMLLGHGVFLTIICASVLFYILTFWVGITRIGKSARAASNAHIDTYAILTDSLLNYETVKYFGGEIQVRRRFLNAVVDLERQWAELFRLKMQNGLAVAAVFVLSLGVSVFIAARNVQHGAMTIGEFVLVIAYVIQLTRPLEMVGFAIRDIAQGTAFIEKMLELLGQEREVEHYDPRISLSSKPPCLVFDQVSYFYHADRSVLKNVSFVVPSGRTVAVVGASGSGKSSLMRLLLRMVEPTGGQIRLNGRPLSNLPLSVLRNAIAVVPQDIVLFNESIAYNIAFGSEERTEADIVSAANVAHIHDFIVGLPDGYETKVGERGLKLSGGEKQRIAIARAVLRKPKIFVFDEATSSLDSGMEKAILDLLWKVTQTTTTLLIAHRLATVVQTDEIVVLDEGTVVERGIHDELLQRGGAYAAMWYAQHSRARRGTLALPV